MILVDFGGNFHEILLTGSGSGWTKWNVFNGSGSATSSLAIGDIDQYYLNAVWVKNINCARFFTSPVATQIIIENSGVDLASRENNQINDTN